MSSPHVLGREETPSGPAVPDEGPRRAVDDAGQLDGYIVERYAS